MATVNPTNPCVNCAKGVGQVTSCDGCHRWFCTKHLLEHRQELSQEMDQLMQQHDQFQHDLTENDRHPLITRINLWEEKSIQRIRSEVAHEAREKWQQPLDQVKMIAQRSLNGMTKALRRTRDTEDSTEINLRNWTNHLKELREQLDRPSTIRLAHDRGAMPTKIPLIRLQMERIKSE
jgi:GTPase involved in cell partitioning and DNA repair